MKNKTWTKIAFYTIVFGWFGLMWVCAWGLWQTPTIRLIIALSSLCLCMFGSMMMTPIFNNATKRLEQKIKEL